MKHIGYLLLSLLPWAMFGCSSAGQDVTDTPVGSVLAGDTTDADDYLDKVERQNAAKTKEAGVNRTGFESHEHTNFMPGQNRY